MILRVRKIEELCKKRYLAPGASVVVAKKLMRLYSYCIISAVKNNKLEGRWRGRGLLERGDDFFNAFKSSCQYHFTEISTSTFAFNKN